MRPHPLCVALGIQQLHIPQKTGHLIEIEEGDLSVLEGGEQFCSALYQVIQPGHPLPLPQDQPARFEDRKADVGADIEGEKLSEMISLHDFFQFFLFPHKIAFFFPLCVLFLISFYPI